MMYVDCSPSEGASPAQPALQRTRGVVVLGIERRGTRSVLARRFRDGAMQLRTPRNVERDVPEVVLVNTAGGLTGGDDVSVEADVGANAQATLTTQACEKIYRASAGTVTVTQHLNVAAGGYAESLPQPTIVFDAARLRRSNRVELEQGARALCLEACLLGRTAMGERVQRGSVDDGWHVRRAGLPVFVERTRFDGGFEAAGARPAMLAGAAAFATCLYVAEDAEARLAVARTSLASLLTDRLRACASAWNGLLCVRWLAADGSELNAALTRFLEDFRECALPRTWYC